MPVCIPLLVSKPCSSEGMGPYKYGLCMGAYITMHLADSIADAMCMIVVFQIFIKLNEFHTFGGHFEYIKAMSDLF